MTILLILPNCKFRKGYSCITLQVTYNCSAISAYFIESVSLVREYLRELRKKLRHKIRPQPKPEVVTLDDSVINETGDMSVQEVAHEEIVGEELPGNFFSK